MNKIDYWFLDASLEMSVDINDIVPDDQGYLSINRKPLDITFEEMAQVLDRLFKQGYLCASKPYGVEGGSTPFNLVEFIPSKSEILEGLIQASIPQIVKDGDDIIKMYPNLFSFSLTPEGGSAWESLSNPQWDIYLDMKIMYSDTEEEGESWVYCVSKETIERFISIEYLLDFGNECHEIIPSTKKWRILSPFKFPYWRTSPLGYELYYKFRYTTWTDNDSGDDNKSLEYLTARDNVRLWYRDTCMSWYDNYFSKNVDV
jgi:hypothetical protein